MSKTTVILASDYEAAVEAAFNLGLGHAWLYPHTPAMVPERIDRLVYVEGWERSPFQTVAVLQLVREHSEAAEVIDQPRSATILGLDALDAQEALRRPRLVAPFMDPGEPVGRPRARRRLVIATVVGVLVLAVIVYAAVVSGW